MRDTWSTFSVMSVRLELRNPFWSTVTLYTLTGSNGNENAPASLVVVRRVCPVNWLLTDTAAPATMAPVESFTVPVIWPLADCA